MPTLQEFQCYTYNRLVYALSLAYQCRIYRFTIKYQRRMNTLEAKDECVFTLLDVEKALQLMNKAGMPEG